MKHIYTIVSAMISFAVFASLAVAAGPSFPSWSEQLAKHKRFEVLTQFNKAAVLDNETGLVWEQSPDTFTRDWVNANVRCITKTVGNRKGWRLPTVQELGSLVDPTVLTGPTLPAGHPFTNVQSAIYWSASTAHTSDSGLAWFVSFDDGHIANVGKADAHNFWCVRGGQGVDPQ